MRENLTCVVSIYPPGETWEDVDKFGGHAALKHMEYEGCVPSFSKGDLIDIGFLKGEKWAHLMNNNLIIVAIRHKLTHDGDGWEDPVKIHFIQLLTEYYEYDYKKILENKKKKV